MNQLRLIVTPGEVGWEVTGDGDIIEAFATRTEAQDAAISLARELNANGRPTSVWRRELDGRLVEARSFSPGA